MRSGLEVARWLVQSGARHLVLAGRRPQPSAQAASVPWSIEADGAQVEIVQADVADRDSLRRALDHVRQTLPPLHGVVHAAGVLDDGVLVQQNWQRFRTVMSPKVEGAWNLDQLTRDDRLDFFVCFSSIAASIGSPGQSNYAAANAFMDGLMQDRQRRGLAGTSINWGPWTRSAGGWQQPRIRRGGRPSACKR